MNENLEFDRFAYIGDIQKTIKAYMVKELDDPSKKKACNVVHDVHGDPQTLISEANDINHPSYCLYTEPYIKPEDCHFDFQTRMLTLTPEHLKKYGSVALGVICRHTGFIGFYTGDGERVNQCSWLPSNLAKINMKDDIQMILVSDDTEGHLYDDRFIYFSLLEKYHRVNDYYRRMRDIVVDGAIMATRGNITHTVCDFTDANNGVISRTNNRPLYNNVMTTVNHGATMHFYNGPFNEMKVEVGDIIMIDTINNNTVSFLSVDNSLYEIKITGPEVSTMGIRDTKIRDRRYLHDFGAVFEEGILAFKVTKSDFEKIDS
jgi:hypothetical protein